jgi:predicted urease superfamily metal-dependent hydrolase
VNVNTLQVPLEELDLRRLREAAEEMREQLGVTSKAVSTGVALGIGMVGLPLL